MKPLLAALAAALAVAASVPASAKTVTYRGTITAHTGGKLDVTLDDGSTGSWSVDAKAKVTDGGKPYPADELHAGDRVALAVTQEGVVERVALEHGGKPKRGTSRGPKAKADKKPAAAPRYWATQKGKGRWWSGTVAEVGADGAFSLRRADSPQIERFAPDAATKVYADASGKKSAAKLDAVREGAAADAYKLDGKTTQIIVHE